jgi:cob(I)alamin adenosyltransferase
MTPADRMQRIDTLLSHVWMVRAFLKHSEEAAEDDELASVHRELYDYMLALGAPFKAGDADEYLRLARKKFSKLRQASELFTEIQPEISSHTNFQMAVQSLTHAVKEIGALLEKEPAASPPAKPAPRDTYWSEGED